MAKIRIDEADDLAVRDVLHAKLSTLEATSTIEDVREYFAASASRRQAFVVDNGRYVGALTPDDLTDQPADHLAAQVAERGTTIGLDEPATSGRDLALRTDARRVPVIDDDGRLVGVVAVTGDLTSFCGTAA
ncbi:MAG: CBS domain-containing protein [Solirubrobacteraceae bacterium]